MSKSKIKRSDKIFGFVSLAAIIICWIIGYNINGNELKPFLKLAAVDAVSISKLENGIFEAKYLQDSTYSSYLTSGKAEGYGGELEVLVNVDTSGNILNSVIVSHKETEAFFQKATNSDLIENISSANYFLPSINHQIDAVSGATYTSKAIIKASAIAAKKIARKIYNLEIPEEKQPEITLDFPSLILFLFFVVAILGSAGKFIKTSSLRWIVMISSLIFIGFYITRPISIGIINKFILGTFPVWQTNIYWYLLLIGILVSLFIFKKNLYCDWICPMGSAQECISKVGGFNKTLPKKFKLYMIWIQRLLALALIMSALLFRNPNYYSYEIFSTFFQLVGNTLQFSLMGIILVMSIFINRPWCNTLCPIRPVTDYIRIIRKAFFKKGLKNE